jgi:hypothetical protein
MIGKMVRKEVRMKKINIGCQGASLSEDGLSEQFPVQLPR